MNTSTLPGALVDCTILVVAFFAWRIEPSLQPLFIGILCSMAGARVALVRRGPPGPGSGGGLAGSSAAVALMLGISLATLHMFNNQGSLKDG